MKHQHLTAGLVAFTLATFLVVVPVGLIVALSGRQQQQVREESTRPPAPNPVAQQEPDRWAITRKIALEEAASKFREVHDWHYKDTINCQEYQTLTEDEKDLLWKLSREALTRPEVLEETTGARKLFLRAGKASTNFLIVIALTRSLYSPTWNEFKDMLPYEPTTIDAAMFSSSHLAYQFLALDYMRIRAGKSKDPVLKEHLDSIAEVGQRRILK